MEKFKEYIQAHLNEEDEFAPEVFNNAADVFENLSEIVTRLADFFSVVSTKGNLYASGDSGRAMIDIRKLVNSVKDSTSNKDKIFTDEELTAMRRISEAMRDVIGKKVVSLSKNISERQKREEKKAASKQEKEVPVEPLPTEEV